MLKKFYFFLLSIAFILSMSVPAFAAETQSKDLPDDAVILYQDENVRIYQSSEASSRVADNYGYAWVNGLSRGSFSVNCTLSGRIYGTFKVESSDPSNYAQLVISGPMNSLPIALDVYAYQGDVYFDFYGSSGQYTINYTAYQNNGMRMMCWLYSNAPN